MPSEFAIELRSAVSREQLLESAFVPQMILLSLAKRAPLKLTRNDQPRGTVSERPFRCLRSGAKDLTAHWELQGG